MLGIQIAGEFLDLPPGTLLELENQNPFLQFDEVLIGEYSLPFQVLPTAKNLRLLNYAGIFQQRVNVNGIDAFLYDKSLQVGAGKVKIEKATININKTSAGLINCYFLSGVSGFWQDIKGIRMRDVEMGGERSFPWDGVITDTGSGFWRHITLVANSAVNDYDYAFYPVVNGGWPSDTDYPDIMNRTSYNASEFYKIRFPSLGPIISPAKPSRIVPFPYLHYVLGKCFEHIGWAVTGDILTDPDFLKITMLSFRAINWCAPGTGAFIYHPIDPVVFDIKDHMPDIDVSAFLIALKNRFGLWFDFNLVEKKATIRYLRDIVQTPSIEMTQYASPIVQKSILSDTKIYSLTTNDGFSGGKLDESVIYYAGVVNTYALRPSPSESIYGWVYFVTQDNTYWVCARSDVDTYEWQILSPNLYDYIPDNSTETITTIAGTTGNEYWDSYLTLIPRIDNPGQWFGRNDNGDEATWGIHLLFYHGPVNKSIASTEQYPYASNHIYDPSMNQVGEWALTYTFIKIGGADVGLYPTFWEAFLNMINHQEEVEFVLYLPLHQHLQINFSDRIIIAGVEIFITKKENILPYNKVVKYTGIKV